MAKNLRYRCELEKEEREPTEPTVHADNAPAKCEKFSFVDGSLAGRILLGFHKQWTDGKFLDVTITADNVNIKAHKSVLSAFSRYFEALFSSNMSDAGLDVVPLNDINGNAVKLLINFAYSGSLEITPENVQDLLFASSYLCIDSVIKACCDYLVRNLSVENCIDIHELTVTLGQVEMKSDVESFMISHFSQLLQENHFLRMNHKLLMALLAKDELILMENNFSLSEVEQEEKLAGAILHYIDEKPEVRQEHLALLLSHGIRLLLLRRTTIESLKSSDRIASSPECLALLNRVLSTEMSSEERERWEHPRSSLVEYRSTKELAKDHSVIQEVPTELFDDSKLFREGQVFFIVGMKLHTRSWDGTEVIGGMEVFYNTGQSVLHGSDNYENSAPGAEFRLGPNERITTVNVQTGWMVDQLEFKTNKGNTFGPYGGDGGGKRSFPCPFDGAYLAYIAGAVDVTEGTAAVRRLRFVWGFPKNSAPKKSHPKRPSKPYLANC